MTHHIKQTLCSLSPLCVIRYRTCTEAIDAPATRVLCSRSVLVAIGVETYEHKRAMAQVAGYLHEALVFTCCVVGCMLVFIYLNNDYMCPHIAEEVGASL